MAAMSDALDLDAIEAHARATPQPHGDRTARDQETLALCREVRRLRAEVEAAEERGAR